jgi:hypothetical protein
MRLARNNSWWDKFGHDATTADADAYRQNWGTHDAVVMGVLGFDVAHDAYAEMHPALAMAIREKSSEEIFQKGFDAHHDRWAVFIRNQGNEGACGGRAERFNALRESIFLSLPGRDLPFQRSPTPTFTLIDFHGPSPQPNFWDNGTVAPALLQVPALTLNNSSTSIISAGEVEVDWGASPKTPPPTIRKGNTNTSPPAEGEVGDPEQQVDALWNSLSPSLQHVAEQAAGPDPAETTIPSPPIRPDSTALSPLPVAASPPTLVQAENDPIDIAEAQRSGRAWNAVCSLLPKAGALPIVPCK